MRVPRHSFRVHTDVAVADPSGGSNLPPRSWKTRCGHMSARPVRSGKPRPWRRRETRNVRPLPVACQPQCGMGFQPAPVRFEHCGMGFQPVLCSNSTSAGTWHRCFNAGGRGAFFWVVRVGEAPAEPPSALQSPPRQAAAQVVQTSPSALAGDKVHSARRRVVGCRASGGSCRVPLLFEQCFCAAATSGTDVPVCSARRQGGIASPTPSAGIRSRSVFPSRAVPSPVIRVRLDFRKPA
jgi:hypothetical protein